MWAADEGQNTGIDLSLSASLTDEGAVAGVVGAVSYIEYENDAQG